MQCCSCGVADSGFFPWSLRCVAAVALLAGFAGAQVPQPVSGIKPTLIERTVPAPNSVGIHPRRPSYVFFDAPLRGPTVPAAAVVVTAGGKTIANRLELSPNGRLLTVHYPSFLPDDSDVRLVIDGGQLVDRRNLLVDADGDGRFGGKRLLLFRTGFATRQPEEGRHATITGYVFDTKGKPLSGAVVRAFPFPRKEGQDPLPVPAATSDSSGFFRYATPRFLGTETLLVEITKPKWSELLRRVEVIAGGCVRVADGHLQPLAPEVMVKASSGATLKDQTGEVELEIPPGALRKDSRISVTSLASANALRDRLPPLVADVNQGRFVDVHGVFGEQTDKQVKMRFPNKYGLPPGTEVPFGKVDHNTLQWSDLRDVSKKATVGKVDPTGKFIEVEFDHFCSICTGYCLPFPVPDLDDGSDAGDGGKKHDQGPGCSIGNSIIGLREGHLEEVVPLPGLREFDRRFGIALGYASYAANPSITLAARARFNNSRTVERTVFQFHVEGAVGTAAYSRSQGGQSPIGTFFWDGRDGLGKLLATGSYPYTIEITSLNSRVPVSIPKRFGGPVLRSFGGRFYKGQPGLLGLIPLRSKPLKGRATLINLQDSPFGAGWRLMNAERLHRDKDDCIVLVLGNSDWRRFVPDPKTANLWVSPSGETSTLSYDVATDEYVRSFPNGTKHLYDADGRISRKVDRYGQETRFAYSGSRVTQITSPTGHWYRFTYDGAGKIQSIADSAKRVTRFQVNGVGDLVSVVDVTGARRRFVYDGDHRLITQEAPRGERSEYTYENGRATSAVARDTTARGGGVLRRRTFAPSALNGELGEAWRTLRQGTVLYPIPIVLDRTDRIVDGRGAKLLRRTNDLGQTVFAEDGLGRRSTFAFDSEERPSVVVWPNKARQTFAWDKSGNLTAVRQYDKSGRLYSTETFEYKGPFELPSKLTDPEGKRTSLSYSRFGNLTSITDHDGNVSKLEYLDSRFIHLPTRFEDAEKGAYSFAYDDHGNLKSFTDFPNPTKNPKGRTTTTRFDVAGNPVQVTDAEGRSTFFSWDAWNRLVGSTDARGEKTVYSYSETGCSCSTANLTKVTLANQSSIEFAYDGLDRLVERRDQLGKKSVAAYDGEGALRSLTNRNGETILYESDLAGQLVRKVMPRGVVVVYRYDEVGNVVAASDPECQLTFAHDFLSRLVSATTLLNVRVGSGPVVPVRHRVAYAYDRVGNRKSLKDDFGTVDQAFTHDNLHRLTSISLAKMAGQKWDFGYDKAGRRTSLVAQPANLTTTYAYDAAGQLERISHGTQPPIVLSYSSYDGLGNVLSHTRQVGAQQLQASFEYDEVSQLEKASFSRRFGDRVADLSYRYDAAGRLLSDDEFTYAYDDEGRLERRARKGTSLKEDFEYDAEGHLLGYRQWVDTTTPQDLVVAEYSYDPLGRRVGRVVNGVRSSFLYDRYNVLHVVDAAGRPDRSFISTGFIDDLIASYDWLTQGVELIHTDRLGSVVATSSKNRSVSSTSTMSEFGNVLGTSRSQLDRHLFTARALDPESGLWHFRARAYDSRVGRFVQEDPIDLNGGLNLYAYVGNNPTNRIDPWGLAPLTCEEEEFQRCMDASAGTDPATAAAGLGIRGALCLVGAGTLFKAGPWGWAFGCAVGWFAPDIRGKLPQFGEDAVEGYGCRRDARLKCAGQR